MTYEEFKCVVVSRIKEYLPEKYSQASISIDSVLKNNGRKLESISIRLKALKLCPTIYLEEYYHQFQKGVQIEDILSEIARVRVEHEDIPDLDIRAITNWKHVRDDVRVKLINAAKNEEFLEDKPHTSVADDLAAVYYLDFGPAPDGSAMTITITDAIFAAYGITIEELHQTAIENISEDGDFFCVGMIELLLSFNLIELASEDDAVPEKEIMYVLTNKAKTNGTGVVLCPKVMDTVAEKIGGDEEWFLLPSSIHEWLIVPNKSDFDAENLAHTVSNVNQTIEPHEVLSDVHVYIYDLKKHELKIAI